MSRATPRPEDATTRSPRIWRALTWRTLLGWLRTLIGSGAILTLFILWRQAEIQSTKRDIELRSTQESAAELRQELRTVQEEYSALKAMMPILDAFGPHVTEFRIWSLRRAVGEGFRFGVCPSDHCLRVLIADLAEQNRRSTVVFHLSGTWGQTLRVSDAGTFEFSVPIIKGCSAFVRTPAVDLGIAVIDDRVSSLKLAAGIRPGTLRNAGMQLETGSCPEGEVQ